MSDLLKDAVARLDQVRRSHLVQSVTYRRGVDSVVFDATIGQTEFEDLDEFGVIHRIQTRDFIVTPADLVLASVQVEPQEGDLLEETEGTTTRTYKVLPIGSNPGWRYSDRYRTMIRIHTKHVQTVTT